MKSNSLIDHLFGKHESCAAILVNPPYVHSGQIILFDSRNRPECPHSPDNLPHQLIDAETASEYGGAVHDDGLEPFFNQEPV